MDSQPLVSVITVCYNSEDYIEDTIESVLNQTYSNLEYIVVDGQSTDQTIEIIKSYEGKFGDQMRWISEPDDGLYDAMNKGIQMANGDIIGILNSDDWYGQNTVESVVNEYLKNKRAVIYGFLRKFDENGFIDIAGPSHRLLEKKSIAHPSSFVPRKLYNEFGLFNKNYDYAADYDFFLRLYKADVEFVRIPDFLANFRVGGVSSENLRSEIERDLIRRRYGIITFKEFLGRVFFDFIRYYGRKLI